jgi:hypothetical protein
VLEQKQELFVELALRRELRIEGKNDFDRGAVSDL